MKGSCRGTRLEEAECFYDSEVNNAIRGLLYEASCVGGGGNL